MLDIEKQAFDKFLEDFSKGSFGTQILGQAFYDHFKLYKIVDQSKFKNIYIKDGQEAVETIKNVFNFT